MQSENLYVPPAAVEESLCTPAVETETFPLAAFLFFRIYNTHGFDLHGSRWKLVVVVDVATTRRASVASLGIGPRSEVCLRT